MNAKTTAKSGADPNDGPARGGAPDEQMQKDRSAGERRTNPVPGTAEKEREATRGGDAPDPLKRSEEGPR